MKGGLGNMPLTLWVLVAGIILYLYIRRANLGIDTHPGEVVTIHPKTPAELRGALRSITVDIGPSSPAVRPNPGTPYLQVVPPAATGGVIQ